MAIKSMTALDVANDVYSNVVYLESVSNLLVDQADALTAATDKGERLSASGNLFTLIHCLDRYLADIKETCVIARKGGVQ